MQSRMVIAFVALIALVHAAPEVPTKKQRIGVIKEDVGNLSGELVQLINHLISCSASFNADVIQDMYDLIGNSNSFFTTADRDSLDNYRDQLRESVKLTKECIEKIIAQKKSLEKIKQVAKNK